MKPPADHFFAALPRLLRRSFAELRSNDPLRMAGATAFFTIFALPPILVMLTQLLRLVLHPMMARNELLGSLTEMVGPEAATQLNRVLTAFERMAQNIWITVGGFVFLMFVATNLFSIIRHSINQIWKIRPRKRKGVLLKISPRWHAIAVILIAGFLFLVGIVAETLQTFISRKLFDEWTLLSLYFNRTVNYLISLVIVTLWFTIMFRYLPDGRPSWRVTLVGGVVTSLLFSVGRFVLHLLLSYSNLNTLYGTSASIVLLLLFVFYASLILYFGAAFTKAYALFCHQPIQPLPHAMHYRLAESPVDEAAD